MCQESDQIETIYALSRKPVVGNKIQHITLDYDDLATLEGLSVIDSIDILVIATGILTLQVRGPEKRIEQLSEAELSGLYHTNAMGPILLAKALKPALAKKDYSLCLALSARVGSISDNHLGGWYSYRASKAALNMLFRGYSIEVARNSGLLVSLYHPGTVSTSGFKEYQSHLDPSQIKQPMQSAKEIWKRLFTIDRRDSGQLVDYAGEIIPF